MMKELVSTILEGREWSWSVVGIGAILFGLIIRSLLLRDLTIEMKVRDSIAYRAIQQRYQSTSKYGWFFFAAYVIGVSLFWRFESAFLSKLDAFRWMVIFACLLVISIILHLRAYAKAVIQQNDGRLPQQPEQSA